MMENSVSVDEFELGLRRQFRYYTRLVKALPTSEYHHKKRLEIASGFYQSEPLQGALADYFFACWYDVAFDGQAVLEELSSRLPPHISQAFSSYIGQGLHMPAISPLATRFSVLVSPSMNVPKHKLYVSKDDAQRVAGEVTARLLAAKANDDTATIQAVQTEYLQHCLACQDRMGFMRTWFALAKSGFYFDETWQACRATLEEMAVRDE